MMHVLHTFAGCMSPCIAFDDDCIALLRNCTIKQSKDALILDLTISTKQASTWLATTIYVESTATMEEQDSHQHQLSVRWST